MLGQAAQRLKVGGRKPLEGTFFDIWLEMGTERLADSCLTFELGMCFMCSGCHNKNTIDWVAYKQQKCISHCSGGWEVKVKAPAELMSDEGPLPSS